MSPLRQQPKPSLDLHTQAKIIVVVVIAANLLIAAILSMMLWLQPEETVPNDKAPDRAAHPAAAGASIHQDLPVLPGTIRLAANTPDHGGQPANFGY